MVNSNALKIHDFKSGLNLWQIALAFLLSLFGVFYLHAQSAPTVENNIITIDEISDGEIFSFGKTVIIKKEVKGVLVFGGDIIVEGEDIFGDGVNVAARRKNFQVNGRWDVGRVSECRERCRLRDGNPA